MAIVPTIKTVTGRYNSSGIINAAREDGMEWLPETSATTDSIKAAGEVITGYKPRTNEFIHYLFGVIGLTKFNYMRFNNPWRWAKRGKLEMGETVQQIWEDQAEVFGYNPVKSQTRFLEMAPNNGASAYHTVNYHVVYKITIAWQAFKRAFFSLTGLRDYVDTKIGSLTRSANADEFMVMKYMLAILLLSGKLKTKVIPAITKDTADDVVTEVAEVTNLFQFPSSDYTLFGNENTTDVSDLMVLESAKVNARIKVNSLAAAFNVEYVKFLGQVVMFDDLSKYNWKRMDKLMSEDPSYRRFTQDELDKLKTVEIICMDKEFMQIYDQLEEMGEPMRNGEGLFENMFYHVSQVLGASPFHNCIVYTTSASAVTSVTVVPAALAAVPGGTYGLSANVVTTGFARTDVAWSVSGNAASGTWIGEDGVLRIADNETATKLTVTATSIGDSTKSGACAVTVTA